MFRAAEAEVRAAGRLLLMVALPVLALALLVNAAVHHPARPAPCVTAAGHPCVFRPHAPRTVAP